ncbi:MAG: tRNA (adenosine(37)-N6)-threonylcarbamoyltransferase complex ATPase subunit type 1 TsaE [Pseudomonadota bacterium]|nr:tRNA (adenosine(37)-N6)-threonylcarbamoyltransferase complex ATPase subunit type 1 TsaE [Gammaproteobacteria bacterium]MEC9227017.1 tRNA (adenosine(37)-N6)-threonylcarbamoyltransferase complex ATPase subunit type 1 TsaE [Pseudomonadota bacterium]GIR52455.1 MAG: tRNA (adenosine(37)-N6)-threonylcarbamoyltransferase complex ATPase subunit type 1 TsaE [Gammaproteobacteria bacterium]
MEELIGEKETEDKAKNFASLIKGFKNSLLINLIGNLGAGKTTFVRGLIQELGFDEFVKSPTFTIVESYESDNLKVFHFDLYRIEDDRELQAIGVEDYLTEENAITLVEWPEKSKRYFNNPDYIIELNHCDNDEKRLINIIKDLRQ